MKKFTTFFLISFLAIYAFAEDSIDSNTTFTKTDTGFKQEDSESESTFSDENYTLPKIITFIEKPVVEQRQSYTSDDIEKMHIADLPSLFKAAGIQILSYGPYGLEQKPSIRGFTDETVRVIINGICVNNPQYGTFDFSTLNPDDIETIEIVRGGFTEGLADEGAVAGAIFITTKNQVPGHHFSTDTKLNTYFNQQNPLDSISQSFSYNGQIEENTFLKTSIRGTAAKNAFQFQNYQNKTKTRKNAEVMDFSGDLQLSHFFGMGNSWTVENLTYGGDKNIPGAETSTTPGNQKDINNNLSFQINFPSITKGLSLNSNINWITTNRFYDQKGTPSSSHFVNTFDYALYSDFHRFKFYRQKSGITFQFVNLNSTDDGKHNQFSFTFKETSQFILNNVISISIPLGIKFCNENFAFTPKLGIKFGFSKLDILLNGYRMIQFPNMDDLYWDSNGFKGNPDLRPESGWGSEITLNFHNILIPFSLCSFINYYEDKIQWSSKNGSWKPENIASAMYYGINLSAEQTFFKFWKINLNLEYLYTKLLDKSNKMTYGNKIMWTPDFTGSLINTFTFNILNFGIELNYTGKRYTSNLNTTYTDPYFLINLFTELNLWKHIIPYLRIDNLLNENYKSIPEYPMPGISLQIGVKTNF